MFLDLPCVQMKQNHIEIRSQLILFNLFCMKFKTLSVAFMTKSFSANYQSHCQITK
jgi:hypothetical protein